MGLRVDAAGRGHDGDLVLGLELPEAATVRATSDRLVFGGVDHEAPAPAVLEEAEDRVREGGAGPLGAHELAHELEPVVDRDGLARAVRAAVRVGTRRPADEARGPGPDRLDGTRACGHLLHIDVRGEVLRHPILPMDPA
jgi:hypothetical protein